MNNNNMEDLLNLSIGEVAEFEVEVSTTHSDGIIPHLDDLGYLDSGASHSHSLSESNKENEKDPKDPDYSPEGDESADSVSSSDDDNEHDDLKESDVDNPPPSKSEFKIYVSIIFLKQQ